MRRSPSSFRFATRTFEALRPLCVLADHPFLFAPECLGIGHVLLLTHVIGSAVTEFLTGVLPPFYRRHSGIRPDRCIDISEAPSNFSRAFFAIYLSCAILDQAFHQNGTSKGIYWQLLPKDGPEGRDKADPKKKRAVAGQQVTLEAGLN